MQSGKIHIWLNPIAALCLWINMSIGLSFTEHSFNNLHLTYIKNNSIILRENGIADCIYKIKLSLQFDSARTYFDINNNSSENSEEEQDMVEYEIEPLLNVNPLGEDRYLVELLCRCLFEEIRRNDPSLIDILVHVPSKVFSTIEQKEKHDKLMEILYNFRNMRII